MDLQDVDAESQRLIEQLLRAEADDQASMLVAQRMQLDHVLRATQNPAASVIIYDPAENEVAASTPKDKAPAVTVAAPERPKASRPRRQAQPTAVSGKARRKTSGQQRADPAPAPARVVRERRAAQNARKTAPRMVDGAIVISDSEDDSADRGSLPAIVQGPEKQEQERLSGQPTRRPSVASQPSGKIKPRRRRVLVISSDEDDGDEPVAVPARLVVQEATKDDAPPPPPIPPVDDTTNNLVANGHPDPERSALDAVVGPDIDMNGVNKETDAEQAPLDIHADHTEHTAQSKSAGKRRAEDQPSGHERAKRARSRHPVDASHGTPGPSRRSRPADPSRSSRARKPGDPSTKRSRAPPAAPTQAVCGICGDEFRITRNPIFESLRPGSSAALPPGLKLPCPGKHAYCLTCIRTVVRNKLEPENKDPSLVAFPIPCPECPRGKWPDGIPFNVAERILDLKDLQLWKLRRRMVHSTRTMWCPNPRCSQQVEADASLVKPNALCPACKEIMCVRCRVRWHKGMTCEEYQALPLTERAPEDAATLLLAHAEKWKQCPHCSMLVELTAGCNHMICRCGAHFCIKCAGEWDRNKGLCSRGCMLWDEQMILRVQEERAQAVRVGPAVAGPAPAGAGELAEDEVSHAQKLIPAPYELPKPLHLDYIGARRPPRPQPPPALPQPRRDMPKKAPRPVFKPVEGVESLLAQADKLNGYLEQLRRQLGLGPPVQSAPLPLVYDYEDDDGDDDEGEDDQGYDDDDDEEGGYDENGEDLEWMFDEDAISDQHWFTANMLDDPFTCGYCEDDFYSLESLQLHLRSTQDHGVWACCGKFFMREIDLTRHQEAYPARFHRHVLKVCWSDDCY